MSPPLFSNNNSLHPMDHLLLKGSGAKNEERILKILVCQNALAESIEAPLNYLYLKYDMN